MMFRSHNILLVALAIWSMLSADLAGAADEQTKFFNPSRIAHAGGALGNLTYTNSYEALNANWALGFRYFEIDFVFTRDQQLVCLHDWKQNFRRTFGRSTERPLTLKQFNSLVEKNDKFKNCTLDGLAKWMSEHRDAFIVTDVKNNNIKALKMIRESLPNAAAAVIPQIYQPENFAVVRDMGFQNIIWTTYRFNGSGHDVLLWVDKFEQPFAITMPLVWARSALPYALFSKSISSYTHTINDKDQLEKLQYEFGVAEIYTDFLAPEYP